MLSAAALFLNTGNNAGLSVLFSALLTGFMQGVNIMLINMTLPFFNKFGRVSTASGVLNSCTYIGSAISAYGIAFLAEVYGWNINLMLWLGATITGTVLSLAFAKPWRRKYM